MNQTFYQELLKENPGLDVRVEEPLKNHTTFHIGGPAEYFAEPDEGQLIRIAGLAAKHGVPITIIGNGSNLLVRDNGIRGMVVAIAGSMSEISLRQEHTDAASRQEHAQAISQQETPQQERAQAISQQEHAQAAPQPVHIYAGAGALLSKLANTAARMGLTGLEFAAGIPGSVGGAVVMNAGAYGGEMKDVLVSVRVLAPCENASDTPAPAAECAASADTAAITCGRILDIPAAGLALSYRHSIIPEKGYIVLGAEFALRAGDAAAIAQTMAELRDRRIEKQPLEYYSAGSTFKRPEGYFAGKLIMDAGLRGYRIGDAQVSEKHCGFVVNRGKATAAEVLQLIGDVQAEVRRQFQVELEPEIKIIGK